MSDPTPAPAPTPTPAPPQQSTPPTPGTPAPTLAPPAEEPLGAGGIKALNAERDARAKAEKDLADLRKQIEDSKKTAEQKAADDIAAANRTAQENAAKALRYEVAAAKGLDLSLAGRLTGSTKEELEADAAALMALIPAPVTPTAPPAQVGPTVPDPGRTPSASVGGQWSKADLKGKKPEEIEAARVAGHLDDLLSGRAL